MAPGHKLSKSMSLASLQFFARNTSRPKAIKELRQVGREEERKLSKEVFDKYMADFLQKSKAEQDLLISYIRYEKLKTGHPRKRDRLRNKLSIKIVSDKDIVEYMFDGSGDLQRRLQEYAVKEGLADADKLDAIKQLEQRQLAEAIRREAESSRLLDDQRPHRARTPDSLL